MSYGYYVTEYIQNVKKFIKDEKVDFNKKLSEINHSPNNPFSVVEYRPELGTLA